MNEIHIFNKSDSNKILYGKFRDIYIPLINNDIICSSLNFYNTYHIKGKFYKKFIKLAIRLFNSRFFIKEYNYNYLKVYFWGKIKWKKENKFMKKRTGGRQWRWINSKS